MANKNRKVQIVSEGDGESQPSLASTYPMIALWAWGYGWVEFGIDGLDRPFVRALDEDGMVWEGQGRYETLDEALRDLEDGLARFMNEEGFLNMPPTKPKTSKQSAKEPHTSRAGPKRAPHRTDNPVIKKVETLEEIAEALQQKMQSDYP